MTIFVVPLSSTRRARAADTHYLQLMLENGTTNDCNNVPDFVVLCPWPGYSSNRSVSAGGGLS